MKQPVKVLVTTANTSFMAELGTHDLYTDFSLGPLTERSELIEDDPDFHAIIRAVGLPNFGDKEPFYSTSIGEYIRKVENVNFTIQPR